MHDGSSSSSSSSAGMALRGGAASGWTIPGPHSESSPFTDSTASDSGWWSTTAPGTVTISMPAAPRSDGGGVARPGDLPGGGSGASRGGTPDLSASARQALLLAPPSSASLSGATVLPARMRYSESPTRMSDAGLGFPRIISSTITAIFSSDRLSTARCVLSSRPAGRCGMSCSAGRSWLVASQCSRATSFWRSPATRTRLAAHMRNHDAALGRSTAAKVMSVCPATSTWSSATTRVR
mmetsp:Transcript_23966/g.60305  ORF Transcript_23966/g.60305 Transcript_23966/m.60305 type:complete len:238 (-) Transcript_23966:961-1674(-)